VKDLKTKDIKPIDGSTHPTIAALGHPLFACGAKRAFFFVILSRAKDLFVN
jgi:hypothetical protein